MLRVHPLAQKRDSTSFLLNCSSDLVKLRSFKVNQKTVSCSCAPILWDLKVALLNSRFWASSVAAISSGDQ